MKKRLLVVGILYCVLLLAFSFLVSAAVPPPVSQSSAPQAVSPPRATSFLPPFTGSFPCDSQPDSYDGCFDYPDCWLNRNGCGSGEKPSYSQGQIYDYDCESISNKYEFVSTKSCKWAKCSGDTLLYSRACGRDGDCRHTTRGDCNTYDGPYSYPSCWMATGGGDAGSERCAAGTEPVADGFRYDYTCREEGSSAKCVRDVGVVPGTICNDGLIVGDEKCDGTNLNSKTCQSEDFSGGTLKCGSGCTSFDTSGCFKCGDNVCDTALGETASNCAADCSKCGNGVVDAGEQCDPGSAATKTRQVSCPGSSVTVTETCGSTEETACLWLAASCPSCSNSVKDNAESGVDCGGNCPAPACALSLGVCAGKKKPCSASGWAACTAADYGPGYVPVENAASGKCGDGLDNDCDGLADSADPGCAPASAPAPASCSNNVRDGTETGVDCGGSCVKGSEVCCNDRDDNTNCLIDENCAECDRCAGIFGAALDSNQFCCVQRGFEWVRSGERDAVASTAAAAPSPGSTLVCNGFSPLRSVQLPANLGQPSGSSSPSSVQLVVSGDKIYYTWFAMSTGFFSMFNRFFQSTSATLWVASSNLDGSGFAARSVLGHDCGTTAFGLASASCGDFTSQPGVSGSTLTVNWEDSSKWAFSSTTSVTPFSATVDLTAMRATETRFPSQQRTQAATGPAIQSEVVQVDGVPYQTSVTRVSGVGEGSSSFSVATLTRLSDGRVYDLGSSLVQPGTGVGSISGITPLPVGKKIYLAYAYWTGGGFTYGLRVGVFDTVTERLGGGFSVDAARGSVSAVKVGDYTYLLWAQMVSGGVEARGAYAKTADSGDVQTQQFGQTQRALFSETPNPKYAASGTSDAFYMAYRVTASAASHNWFVGSSKLQCAGRGQVDGQFGTESRLTPGQAFCLDNEPWFLRNRECVGGICASDAGDLAACDKASDCVFNGFCYTDLDVVAQAFFSNDKKSVLASAWRPEVTEAVGTGGRVGWCDPGQWNPPPPETVTVTGFVRNVTSGAVPGATVKVLGTLLSATTAADGSYTVSNVKTGTYDLTASKPTDGYDDASALGQVVAASTAVDFTMLRSLGGCTNGCTLAGSSACDASCHGKGGCWFSSDEAKAACDGTFGVVQLASGNYVECCKGLQYAPVKAEVSVPSDDVVVSKRPVLYQGKLVNMVVVLFDKLR